MGKRAAKKYTCECIDCGYTVESDKHCADLTCSKCGGQMRRKDRPGPGKSFRHSSTLLSPEPQWNSIVKDMLPAGAFVPGSRLYPHHWIKGGEADKDSGRYESGKMYLSKGGLIEAVCQARKSKVNKEVINHLEDHLKEAGIEIREGGRTNIYEGITGEIEMKGIIPKMDEVDLNRVVAKIDMTRSRSGDDIEGGELDKINQLARADLKKADVYLFPVWASNDQVDSYFTRMDAATTLQNYVTDFNSGRSLMLSHAESMFGGSPVESMPIGSSFDSRITTRADEPGNWVEAWLYILRNIEMGGLKTDDAIRMIEAGIWRRVSIGFTINPIEGRPAGHYVCSICGNDIMSGDCEHLPGREYDGKICIADVFGAGLREVSLVYMNAAQGTVVQKARVLAEQGRLQTKEILGLESFYGVRFFDTGLSEPGNRESQPGSQKTVPDTERNIKKEKTMEELRAILLSVVGLFSSIEGASGRIFSDLTTRTEKAADESGLGIVGKDVIEAAREFLGGAQETRKLIDILPEDSRTAESIRSLLVLAEDGKSHRVAIMTSALEEGVRFEGEGFDKDHWTSVLESLSLDQLIHQRDIWKGQADGKLAAGQRSQETPGDGTVTPPVGEEDKRTPAPLATGRPDEAYVCGQAHI